MQITKREIPVRDLYEGYDNDEENGVYAYDGKLCCRPPFQREFCYKDKQRDAVIKSVQNGFPLNTMYWAVTKGGNYELLDGQQRTLSLLEYIDGAFSIDFKYFFNLSETEQDAILDYKLDIYICDGTDAEKLEWFKVINTVGERLTNQELLNAVYAGQWLTDAKKYFSKTNCPASNLAADLMAGAPIRQDYLETVLGWIADATLLDPNDPDSRKMQAEEYMAKHQGDKSAIALWTYFQQVVDWVRCTFPTKRPIMKGVEWGLLYNKLYNKYHDVNLNADALENDIRRLLADKDVTNQKGIYPYLLSGDEKFLNIRAFDPRDKQRKYNEQNGICPLCGGHFELTKMDGDHILPWRLGGKTEYDNLRMLCIKCNRSHNDYKVLREAVSAEQVDPNLLAIDD